MMNEETRREERLLLKKKQEELKSQAQEANDDNEVSIDDDNHILSQDLSQPTDDEGWFDKTDNSGQVARSPPTLHPVSFKNLSKNDLVWAKLYGFKGGAFMYFARRCSPSEGATLEHIPMPIPADQMLVEFIGIPTTFHAMQLVSDENIVPFNKPLTKSRQTTLTSTFAKRQASVAETLDEWDPDRCSDVHAHINKKFGRKYGDLIYEEAYTMAKNYLAHVLAIQHNVTEGNATIDRVTLPSPLEDSIDLTLFAREGGAASSPLRPGDTIEYEHRIMKKTLTSIVVSICRNNDAPVRLQNDDFICSTDLVRKLGKENSAYRLLSEFSLEYGDVERESLMGEIARETRRELEDIARDTGYGMIPLRKRQRTEKDSIPTPLKETPQKKTIDVDIDLSSHSPVEAPHFKTPQSSRYDGEKTPDPPSAPHEKTKDHAPSPLKKSGNKKKK